MSSFDKIRNYCIMIDHLNDNTVASIHQIKLKDEAVWHDSVPTYFIYSFFTFNSIYSIDWEKTKDRTELTYTDYGENLSIKRLLDFCFRDPNKQDLYYLNKFVSSSLQEDFVKQTLDYIKPDKSEIGNVVYQEKDNKGIIHHPIEEFKEAFNKFIKTDNPSKTDCITIALFIYRVRCNLFHGLKLVCQLGDPNENVSQELDKMKIYTIYLNQLNSFCIRQIKRQLHLG